MQQENNESHENLRILVENHEDHENLKIARENYENHENQIIPIENHKKMKTIEFCLRIKQIIKII